MSASEEVPVELASVVLTSSRHEQCQKIDLKGKSDKNQLNLSL